MKEKIAELELQSSRNSYKLLSMAMFDKKNYAKVKKAHHKKFFSDKNMDTIYNCIHEIYENTGCQKIGKLEYDDLVFRNMLDETQSNYFKRIIETYSDNMGSIEDLCCNINKINFVFQSVAEKKFTEDYILDLYNNSLTDLELYDKLSLDNKRTIKVYANDSNESSKAVDSMSKYFDELFSKEGGLTMNLFPYLEERVGGWVNGVTYLGGHSGTGKSTIAISSFVLDALRKPNEKVLYLANEQTEATIFNMFNLAYYNNVVLGGLSEKEKESKIIPRHYLKPKYIKSYFLDENGKPNKKYETFMEYLKKTEQELGDRLDVRYLSGFNEDVIESIAEEAIKQGYNNIVLDTFKHADENSTEGWKALSSLATRCDAIAKKHESKNVRIVATIQLYAGTSHRKFLTVDCIGKSKQIKETAETMVLFRKVLPHEKKDLKYITGNSKNLTIQVLDETKEYFLFFVEKSRNGESGDVLVIEYDFNTFMFKELGKVINIENDSQGR